MAPRDADAALMALHVTAAGLLVLAVLHRRPVREDAPAVPGIDVPPLPASASAVPGHDLHGTAEGFTPMASAEGESGQGVITLPLGTDVAAVPPHRPMPAAARVTGPDGPTALPAHAAVEPALEPASSPARRPRQSRTAANESDIEHALDMVRDGVPVRRAARDCGVSESTLRGRLKRAEGHRPSRQARRTGKGVHRAD